MDGGGFEVGQKHPYIRAYCTQTPRYCLAPIMCSGATERGSCMGASTSRCCVGTMDLSRCIVTTNRI